jgi:hypothetical protein
MSIDLTGGYDPSFDYPLSGRPENPKMRDSVSMWIQNNSGDFGLPRFCIEAVAGEWHNRGIEANIAFPDGRVLIGAGGFGFAEPKLRDGRQVTLNAGPLTFEVIEPLRHWRMTFDGSAYETTVFDQAKGVTDGPRRRVRIEVDAHMAAPPWIMGESLAGKTDATAKAVGAVGGHRHEQLFRCTGSMAVEGEAERPIDGTGLRIRRFGDRDVGEFPGHCWMSALFPSGKAFGLNAFPPRLDGTPAWSEAFVFDGREKKYGKVIEAPWMTRFEPVDGPCDLLLELDDGQRVAITGRTRNSTFIAKGSPMFGDWTFEGGPHGVALPFHQGDALYTMGGESAYGMIERSLPVDRWEVLP